MQYEKYIKYAATAIGVVVGLMLLPFALRLFLPFIIAFIIASPCQRLVHFLNRKLKINRGISSAVIVTLLVALISWIVFMLCCTLYNQAKSFIAVLPEMSENFKNSLAAFNDKYDELYEGLSPKLKNFFDSFKGEFTVSLKSSFAPYTAKILNVAKRFAYSLPDIVVFFFMFLLSTFFITKDYMLIKNFFYENCPEKVLKIIRSFKNTAFSAFLTYIKAQLILMTITFSIVTVALWILGTKYPFVMGFVIGFVDALPFFGTAIIIVPWAFASFVSGKYVFALGLMITQVIAFTTRQLLEPKIVSSQIGLHPLVTLVSMYVGLNLLGVGGIIIGPILALFFVNAYVSVKSKKDI